MRSERIRVDSLPPTSIEVLPLIGTKNSGEHTYGKFTELAPVVSASVSKCFETFSSFSRFASLSQKGSRHCAERTFNTHSTFWTIECPGQFTCKTCFNRRQPCMRAIGEHQWIVLPLPPAVRYPSTVWQDNAYYIRPYEENSTRFSGTWRLEPHNGRGTVKQEKEVRAAPKPSTRFRDEPQRVTARNHVAHFGSG